MKILLLPSAPNPYQRELVSALGTLGVTAEVGTQRRFLPVLRAVFESGKPDVFHLHWIDNLALGRGLFKTAVKGMRLLSELVLLRLLGVRIVWTMHNLIDHQERSPRLQMLINMSVARLASRVIVHSHAAGSITTRALRLSPGRLSVILHASFAGTYSNNITQLDARRVLGLPRKAFVYLHFGVLREYKGTRELIRCFQGLDHPNARLLIVGRPADVDLGASIQAAASKNPRILTQLSFVPDEDVQLYLNASDVVVMPYRESLTSGVAMLAMAFGKPVITPRTSIMEEVLEPEANLLYDREDGDVVLAAAMEEAMKSDLKAMGRLNASRALNHSWDQMAAQTKDVYKSVLSIRDGPEHLPVLD